MQSSKRAAWVIPNRVPAALRKVAVIPLIETGSCFQASDFPNSPLQVMSKSPAAGASRCNSWSGTMLRWIAATSLLAISLEGDNRAFTSVVGELC